MPVMTYTRREFPSYRAAWNAWKKAKRTKDARESIIGVGPIYLLGQYRYAFDVWPNTH